MAACYFCGTVLEAPDPVRPAGDGGPALDLCAECATRLEPIVDAVVDAAGGASGDGTVGTAGADAGAPGTGESTPGATTDGRDDAADVAPTQPDRDGSAHGAESPGDDDQGSVDVDAADGPGSDVEATAGDQDPDPDGGEADATSTADGLEARGVSPTDYKRVLRLLQNREFPVERAEIEAVLTSAYEFSPETVEAVLEAAVDRDVVAVDDEGRLVAPE